MPLFLLLSLLSGALELGVLFLGCVHGLPLWGLFVLPLMYQLGNLLLVPFLMPPRRTAAVGGAGLVLLLLDLRLHSPALFAVLVLLASLCIQAARSGRKNECPVWLKRSFRIAGFLLSPLAAVFPVAVVACCLLLPTVVLLFDGTVRKGPAPPARLMPVMVFHQMHYFVYAYILPAWLFSRSGMALSAGMFALSWLVYLLPQTIAGRVGGVDSRAMFFVCHSFLFLVMTGLCAASAFGSPAVICALWLLTGVGGGSVFCIKSLTPACRSADMTLSENVGHVLGCLAALLLSACFPDGALPVLTGTSALFVSLTLASAAFITRKEANGYAAGK
ncbi:MAG: hypothetical protein ACI3W8_00030 [Oscillospiraceae bacterium]